MPANGSIRSNNGLPPLRLPIKPLSVNEVWQGKRFKTPAYKRYEKDVITLLRPLVIPDGDLQLNLKWGFSSAASDIDNPVKPFIDCLQKKYQFNDKRIKSLVVDAESVAKGAEYVEFSIKALCKEAGV